MKHLTLALVFCTIGVIHSQTFRYYKVGQKFTMDDNACLIIKKDLRLLLHIEDLEHYKEVKAVKLVGFRDHEFDMDSLMGYLSDYTKIKCLMFEDCDLNDLTEPLSNFTELRDLRILKKSSFYENFFFRLLKDNQIESLTFQKSEPDLVMDSLVLLRHLKTVSVGNNNTFVTPNKITNYQFGSKETLRTIPFAYYGTFLKNETITVRKPKEKKTNSDLKPRPMACIRQPIPGIKINDTLYSFNAATGTSASYKSGSVLTIDKNAFVKSDGQAYEGRVQLFYREFRNPVEIMLSGIPMTTKVNDQTMLFKSGGMYEISAYDASGNELKTKSDTSVKINFALTDTSQNFQFFSLNDNGSWTTTSPSVAVTSPNATGPVKNATKAVIEYYGYYYQRPAKRADTTDYNSRFLSKDYLYTYRKDNLEAGRDSVKYLETYATLLKKNGRIKSMFRIKYLKETKEKDILFTIVLAKNNLSYDVPAHVQSLLNKTYVYTGNLSKDEFRKTFSRKLLCWDFRPNTLGEEISLHIKTNRSFIDLKAKMVYTHRDGTYHIPRKANKILNNRLHKDIAREARAFNKKDRYQPGNQNDMNNFDFSHQEDLAFKHCKKYQNQEEAKMDLREWKKYIRINYPYYYINRFQNENTVGNALVKSGMGVKNIDCYLHSGQMENILVKYDRSEDSLSDEYNAMLYENINTSYPVTKNYMGSGLTGYYFKNSPNYLIRFSDNGYMQVTKPAEMKALRKGGYVNVKYMNEYNVKNLSSGEITRLILN